MSQSHLLLRFLTRSSAIQVTSKKQPQETTRYERKGSQEACQLQNPLLHLPQPTRWCPGPLQLFSMVHTHKTVFFTSKPLKKNCQYSSVYSFPSFTSSILLLLRDCYHLHRHLSPWTTFPHAQVPSSSVQRPLTWHYTEPFCFTWNVKTATSRPVCPAAQTIL